MPNSFRHRKVLASALAVLFSSGSVLTSAAIGAEVASGAADATTTSATTTATGGAAASTGTTSTNIAVPNAAAAGAANSSTASDSADSGPVERIPFKPGQTLTTVTDTEDIVATYDVELAKKQCAAYSDSPEAAFILAVALTRTSRVEEALKEVQRARKLTETKGGPAYFDKMISSYEQMLKSYPDDNRVRYGLAWAYYMKAYLLAENSRRSARWKKNMAAAAAAAKGGANGTTSGAGTTSGGATANASGALPASVSKDVSKALKGGDLSSLATAAAALAGNQNLPAGSLPHIPGALENAEPADIPQIKQFFELALGKLDEIVKRDPEDVWTLVYRAHLRAEYSGDLAAAMATWRAVEAKYPNNPAPHFFMGEGYLKLGNLKESINHVSKAIALRALGN
jgi:tetratricopeptide (TPR) repeat protein